MFQELWEHCYQRNKSLIMSVSLCINIIFFQSVHIWNLSCVLQQIENKMKQLLDSLCVMSINRVEKLLQFLGCQDSIREVGFEFIEGQLPIVWGGKWKLGFMNKSYLGKVFVVVIIINRSNVLLSHKNILIANFSLILIKHLQTLLRFAKLWNNAEELQ